MAHLFKQMYLEDITDIEKQFTPEKLTTAITMELIKRKIDELQRQKEIQISTTQTNQLFSWWNYSNEAKQQIEQQQMWKLILEAFKIIHYNYTFTCYDVNSMCMCCSRAMTSILCACAVHVLFMRYDVIVGIPLLAIWGGGGNLLATTKPNDISTMLLSQIMICQLFYVRYEYTP